MVSVGPSIVLEITDALLEGTSNRLAWIAACQPLGKSREIDHDALVLAAPDFFVTVQCAYLERDVIADDLRYFSDGYDRSPGRGCREVLYVDVRANDSAQLTHREPVVAMSRADASRSRGVDAIERAIAKEDAKIIAKASARALRRGLH